MNENEWGNDQQYDSGYQQQYDSTLDHGLKESLPEGMMERLPGWIRDKAEDVIAKVDQEKRNQERYGHVEPYSYKGRGRSLFTVIAAIIGFGGACLSVFFMHNFMIALICFGIMFILKGIEYLSDKNYCFRKAPIYTAVLVLGVIFILVPSYHLAAKYFPALPQPESRGMEAWICGLFTVIGAVMLILQVVSYLCMKKICTEPVSAVCVHVKKKVRRTKENKTTIKYSGIFEYPFRGVTYLAAEPYDNNGAPNVGDRYELYINPNDPTDFYRKSWALLLRSLLFDMLFIVFPLIAYQLL